MSVLRNLKQFFDIQKEDAEFNYIRFNILARQIPLMYGILIINMVAVIYTHYTYAPIFLTLICPLILTALIMRRMRMYLQVKNQILGDDEVIGWLRSTVYLAGVLGFCIVAWALSLFNYGNAYTQGHLAFFVCLTIVASVFCMIYLRQAAVALTIVSAAPAAFIFIMSGQMVFIAIAMNMILVVCVMLFIMSSHYDDFRIGFNQKKTLLEQSSKLEILNAENLKLANLDALTNLPNRRFFFSELASLTTDARQKHYTFVVGMLDLDGFKPVNDIFGHQAGDYLLLKVSERLRSVLGDDVIISRLGGDEFGLIIKNPESEKWLLTLGELVCSALKVPFDIKGSAVQVAGTLGFADFPNAGETPDELFERADYALYYSKQHSKGKPVIFSSEHEKSIKDSSQVAHQLFEADLENEISVVFQPIVDARTGRTLGLESLARWDSPLLGRVSPDIFIRSAEQSGLISKLTRIILVKALEGAKKWPEDVYLSFNLSSIDLASSTAILSLMQIVEKSGFPVSRVIFEITESAIMQDYTRAIETLHYIKRLGAKIALDDFGTGYSSLGYVQRLPIDRIKIDRSFILEIENDKTTRDIVHTIVDLCRNLDLDCVVEGVETVEQLSVLQKLGCQMIQGYYFSRPLKPLDAQNYLENQPPAMHAISA